MAMTSLKNLPLTSAASQIGLTDNLTNQVQANLAAQKLKRRMFGQNPHTMAAQALGLRGAGAGTSMLGQINPLAQIGSVMGASAASFLGLGGMA